MPIEEHRFEILLIFVNFLCCVGTEILHLKDSMRLMQKLTFFLCKLENRLQIHIQYIGYTDTLLFPTTGKAGDVATFGIYWSLFPVFQYSDKNLLPTYLNFYADRYPTCQ
jgi:hypothetical protein